MAVVGVWGNKGFPSAYNPPQKTIVAYFYLLFLFNLKNKTHARTRLLNNAK